MRKYNNKFAIKLYNQRIEKNNLKFQTSESGESTIPKTFLQKRISSLRLSFWPADAHPKQGLHVRIVVRLVLRSMVSDFSSFLISILMTWIFLR